ncbi:MAG: superoxide dismutase [Calditrichaeota bacterium]|nr:MAG: superoxide dismutase [Calditrichota bacterium]MBL1207350.1 superoxide dismutase [Calditrichota bacterium]NOG47182.1 superoxide dismutase [Calditrichota bacterium]
MKQTFVNKFVLFLLLIFILSNSSLFAHCQIPCGIYGDQMRIMILKEHVTTIEKSMNKIIELSKAESINYNQLVRWVNNKDQHAQEMQDIVTAYFLTQRIKPVDLTDKEAYKSYSEKTTTLQQILFYAMKTKQTTDLKHGAKLTELIDQFSKSYFSAEDLKHLKEHK